MLPPYFADALMDDAPVNLTNAPSRGHSTIVVDCYDKNKNGG
jgi:hypothetical protein